MPRPDWRGKNPSQNWWEQNTEGSAIKLSESISALSAKVLRSIKSFVSSAFKQDETNDNRNIEQSFGKLGLFAFMGASLVFAYLVLERKQKDEEEAENNTESPD